jgi:hypothetical protein
VFRDEREGDEREGEWGRINEAVVRCQQARGRGNVRAMPVENAFASVAEDCEVAAAPVAGDEPRQPSDKEQRRVTEDGELERA